MKPIKVICPICGEEMTPDNWGKKREMIMSTYPDANGVTYPGETINYVKYFCSCGCEMHYKGTKSCWQECKCAKGNSC